LDLGILAEDDAYREIARDAIGAFAGAWDRIGVHAAGYGSVAARLCREPLVVAVAAEPGSDLHRAALRIADHEKLVVPNADDRGFEPGTASLVVDDDVYPAETPDELMEIVAAHA
jgi:uncharacterized protein YyaL (SSP411 family)